MDTKNKHTNTDEIDLIDLIRHLWSGRWLIIKITGLFIALGLLIALTSTEQFIAEAKILPEAKGSSGGAAASLLRQFGGFGGFSMAEGADAVRPDLYPEVLKSTPFYLELIDLKISIDTDEGEEVMSLYYYLTEYSVGRFNLIGVIKKYTVRLPWTVIGWFRTSQANDEDVISEAIPQQQIIKLSKKKHDAIENLKGSISSSINDRNGVISISVEFSDPAIAAQIAQFSLMYISEYITKYRIEKVQKDLEFVKLRYDEKKQEYENAQLALAKFRDANRNVQTAALRVEEEQLQHRSTLSFNVYNGLAQQLEQARIKVQEETPVIKVLEPVREPVKRSKPKRGLIVIVTTFLGGFLGIGIILVKLVWSKFKREFGE